MSFEDYFEIAPIAMCVLGSTGDVLEANRAARELLGATKGDLDAIGLPFTRWLIPDEEHRFESSFKQVKESSDVVQIELKLMRAALPVVMTLVGVPAKDAASEQGVLASFQKLQVATDSDPVQALNADRLRHAILASRDGVWDWDITTGHVFFSPQGVRLLGFAQEEVEPSLEFFTRLIHPDDVERVNEVQQAHFAGRTPQKQLEVRLRTKSGEYRWFLDRGEVVERNADGQATRMVGTITDITDRKEAERESERALSLLRATIESTTDGILVVNSNRSFEIYNKVFRNICGISDELLAKGGLEVATQGVFAQAKEPEPFLEKIHFLEEHPHHSSFDTIHTKDDRVFEVFSCPQVIDSQVVGRVWSFRDVTERKIAEAAQAEALNRLQKIASRIPGVVYQYRLRPDGTTSIPYASEGMKEMFDIEPSNLVENADVSSKIVDHESFMASVRESAEQLTPWVHEMQVRQADGSLRWVAGNSVPEREPDGSIIWHGFITDVTERKLAEAKLRENERRLREAQAISQIGNFHWDAITQRVTWSDQLYRLYDQDPSSYEPTLESYLAAIHPDDRQRVTEELQGTLKRLGGFDHEYRIHVSDGQSRWVRARGYSLVDADGNLLGLEGTCQDISKQKQTEATTASLEAQLRESQKMEAIGTLAGGIAHDFNNILASILGNVELALPDALSASPTVHNCLLDICKAGERARDLVQQILSFSRRQPTQRIPISVGEVVGRVSKLLMATLPARLTLDVQCSAETPWILGDATQIEQVVLNLATNAMQAMNGDRGCIRIEVDSLFLEHQLMESNASLRAVQARSAGPVVRLVVSDDGPGMSPETQCRIFEPFFTTKSMDQGTGLGLAVVHGIVQRHDGVVTVDSQLGGGATFTIYLPAAECPSVPAGVESSAPQTTSPVGDSKQQHVLYIDDDEGVLAVAEQLLQRGGFRASCFADHRAALQSFSNNPMDFDLAVTDYNMPGMHGLEVAREIRKIREDLPIVITSGYVDAELIAGAEACGVRELLAKPFRLAELNAVLERVVKKR